MWQERRPSADLPKLWDPHVFLAWLLAFLRSLHRSLRRGSSSSPATSPRAAEGGSAPAHPPPADPSSPPSPSPARAADSVELVPVAKVESSTSSSSPAPPPPSANGLLAVAAAPAAIEPTSLATSSDPPSETPEDDDADDEEAAAAAVAPLLCSSSSPTPTPSRPGTPASSSSRTRLGSTLDADSSSSASATRDRDECTPSSAKRRRVSTASSASSSSAATTPTARAPITSRIATTMESANGHADPAAPATAAVNGNAHLPQHVDLLSPHGTYRVGRTELVRLLVDELRSLGYDGSASALEAESGVTFEHHIVRDFRAAVLAGEWAEAERLLDHAQLAIPEKRRFAAKFLLKEERYLEALEAGNVAVALQVLQTELAPLQHNLPRLHALSSFLMFTDPAELRAQAHWPGVAGGSRQAVLERVQAEIPPSVMVRPRRLEELLAQAFLLQESRCTYHNLPSGEAAVRPAILYADHTCDAAANFPARCSAVFTDHNDEVWHLAFSNRGDRLAAGGKNGKTYIWDMQTKKSTALLEGHTDAVAFLSWSPDDTVLLTASNDNTARLWSTTSGELQRTISAHEEAVTACGWLPDGEHFITGGLDKKLVVWKCDGTQVHAWTGHRVTDLYVSADGRVVVAASTSHVRIYDLATYAEILSFEEADAITSLCLSRDARFLLTNTSQQELHMWDLRPAGPAGNVQANGSAGSSAVHSRATTGGSAAGAGFEAPPYPLLHPAQPTSLGTFLSQWPAIGGPPAFMPLGPSANLGGGRSAGASAAAPPTGSGHVLATAAATASGGTYLPGSSPASLLRNPLTAPQAQLLQLQQQQQLAQLQQQQQQLLQLQQTQRSRQASANNAGGAVVPAGGPALLAPQLVRRFKGHKQGRFVIRSSFGGAGEAFLVSGSEDSRAYIWHRASGDLLASLEGHTATVNAATWNPAVPGMLATCSDDGTVRVWTPKAGIPGV
ncbi:hypothetical protein H9P43_001237 [Blastocladiella emersonii ATCC 22665]|nr:hypothetical protein H9P43_001237 [Blastocladiella emersonii ATCC 22665]